MVHAGNTCTGCALPTFPLDSGLCRVLPSSIHETRIACARRCVGPCSTHGCTKPTEPPLLMSVARLGVMFVLSVLQSGMPDFFQCMRIQSLFCAVWLSQATGRITPVEVPPASPSSAPARSAVVLIRELGPNCAFFVANSLQHSAWLKFCVALRMSITLPSKSICC